MKNIADIGRVIIRTVQDNETVQTKHRFFIKTTFLGTFNVYGDLKISTDLLR